MENKENQWVENQWHNESERKPWETIKEKLLEKERNYWKMKRKKPSENEGKPMENEAQWMEHEGKLMEIRKKDYWDKIRHMGFYFCSPF